LFHAVNESVLPRHLQARLLLHVRDDAAVVVHLRTPEERAVWFEGYVPTYLERDLLQRRGPARGRGRRTRKGCARSGGSTAGAAVPGCSCTRGRR